MNGIGSSRVRYEAVTRNGYRQLLQKFQAGPPGPSLGRRLFAPGQVAARLALVSRRRDPAGLFDSTRGGAIVSAASTDMATDVSGIFLSFDSEESGERRVWMLANEPEATDHEYDTSENPWCHPTGRVTGAEPAR